MGDNVAARDGLVFVAEGYELAPSPCTGRGAPLVVGNLIGNLRFIVVEVVISSGRPTGTAATIADVAVKLFGERLHLAPQDVLFVFHEVEPNLPRFPAASIRRFDPKADIRGRG
jgi:hypothetical protein